jgi:polyribonucleotide nucleotidyltransferase
VSTIQKTFQYGDTSVTLETGRIARQADGAVLVTMGKTVVLATIVADKKSGEGRDFFPLTVNYQERTYSAGRIPGGYFKREGRPSEMETLTSRLIDRKLRPMFPKGFNNEVQVITTVLSVDQNNAPDVAAMIGASAAVAVSGVPFSSPLGAARVGYKNNEYLLNPDKAAREESDLDLVMAGTEHAVLMVESEAKELSEEVMLGAVTFGHEQMQVVIKAINELVKESGTTSWDWTAPKENEALFSSIDSDFSAGIAKAYEHQDKKERLAALSVLRHEAFDKFIDEANKVSKQEVATLFGKIEKRLVRAKVIAGDPRIDGRDSVTIRPIRVETGILPAVHGSALFTRGETQAIVVVTLGTDRDAQTIDALAGEYKDQFMLHYNFPPYSVGEVGFMGGPKRREIGHGRLAKRGLQALMPSMGDDFPYVVRLVSEITESNGSSSMATVCGGSMALMDAGVPLKAPVAGIAMGLVKEGDKFAVLSDILGDEDHLGDMDFKVAGTQTGITALQMDIKIDGITTDIMQKALVQAHNGRLHILGIMSEEITEARSSISDNAPQVITIQVKTSQIREIIGKGGEMIKSITERTGATIDISDTGLVKIAAVDKEAGQQAYDIIAEITLEIEAGQIYHGKVVKIAEFGAFVNLKPGKDGLVHVSQISDERVEDVSKYVKEGEEVTVKVLEVDRQGRIRLSMKDVDAVKA